MLKISHAIFIVLTTLILLSYEQPNSHANENPINVEKKVASDTQSNNASRLSSASVHKISAITEFTTIQWTDLMPKEDLDALLNPPSYITDIEDGSFEDKISDKMQNSSTTVPNDRYQQALNSVKIVSKMNGKGIRIPGFIVPLEFDDEQTITQFFLVPFFGACIHVPPPPPNQIIFVNFPEGLTLRALYDPFWIEGVLNTSLIENQIATAAYSMEMTSYEAYKE